MHFVVFTNSSPGAQEVLLARTLTSSSFPSLSYREGGSNGGVRRGGEGGAVGKAGADYPQRIVLMRSSAWLNPYPRTPEIQIISASLLLPCS